MYYRDKSAPWLNGLALLLVAAALLVLGACNSGKGKGKGTDDRKPTVLQKDDLTTIDRWAVESPMRASMEAAVVRGRVLYDYHFVDGMAHMTAVGRRDAEILARHFRGETWVLSVRQGDASKELYAARIEMVRSLMAPLGVTETGLAIVDAAPGGEGLAAADARRIRKESEEGAGSLESGNTFDGGTTIVRPIDTPLEGGS